MVGTHRMRPRGENNVGTSRAASESVGTHRVPTLFYKKRVMKWLLLLGFKSKGVEAHLLYHGK